MDGEKQAHPYQCRFCSELIASPCEHCLKEIITNAANTYKQINMDQEIKDSIPNLDKDPRQDLALVIGTSLLKLAGFQKTDSEATGSPLLNVHPGLFLYAILILDIQLKETPSDNGLRLLLVQLYLLLGTASHAHQFWVPMDVKRTIQDALSPLFFDRISSLSPALFQGSRPLMDALRSYYGNSLRDDCPLRIWDAFSAGSYTSILDMAEYDTGLRRSCTLMMTLVEEARATRSFGGKIDIEIADHPLACGYYSLSASWQFLTEPTATIRDDTFLLDKTDYGSFPNLESPHGPPIQNFVRLGPQLSVR